MKSLNLDLKNTGNIPYWTWINFMIYWIWTWKILELPYWTQIDFICWTWAWKILELPYWIWIDFIKTGFELINQPSRDAVTKVWRLSWINFFLPFSIMLIRAAFTAPSFGNFYMMISPPTLLRFLCSSGYCMSLSHMSITHLECFPIL